MDNRYTPTTDEVHGAWIALTRAPDSFTRWLNEVKAQAWQEGWDTKPPYQEINNPYRQGEEQ